MLRLWPFVGVLIGAVVMALVIPEIPKAAPTMRVAAAIFYPTMGLLVSLVLHAILTDERSGSSRRKVGR